MQHAIETELKMILTHEQFNKLLSFYQPIRFVKQVNTYYKNNNSSHYAFRIREKEGRTLFTLKQKTDDGVMEYEKYLYCPIEEDEDVVRTLNDFNVHQPYEILGTLVTYRAMYCDELAELCFDINLYNGITDYEVEYEIKKEHDYEAAFISILNKADIRYVPNKISKYKRFANSVNY